MQTVKRRRRIKRVVRAPHGPKLPYNAQEEVPRSYRGPFIMCNGIMRIRNDATEFKAATEADR